MEQKIYVAGLTGSEDEQKTAAAVSAVAGVKRCVVNFEKAQVFVDYDENTADIEKTIRDAISSCGFDVLD